MRSKHVSLILVPMLLTACSRDNTLHQDVYNNQYDCLLDWGIELCAPEEENTGSSTYVATGYGGSTYLGPQYYKKNRKVKIIRTGQERKAFARHSVRTKISQQMITNAPSRPIRGGFGRSGGSGGG